MGAKLILYKVRGLWNLYSRSVNLCLSVELCMKRVFVYDLPNFTNRVLLAFSPCFWPSLLPENRWDQKNPAYGRHQLSLPMGTVVAIPMTLEFCASNNILSSPIFAAPGVIGKEGWPMKGWDLIMWVIEGPQQNYRCTFLVCTNGWTPRLLD